MWIEWDSIINSAGKLFLFACCGGRGSGRKEEQKRSLYLITSSGPAAMPSLLTPPTHTDSDPDPAESSGRAEHQSSHAHSVIASIIR